MSFLNLKLIEPLLKALNNEGYTQPTPIQEQSIPIILNRKDLLGCAQTGTGKTAAFAIPILQILQEDTMNNTGNTSDQKSIAEPPVSTAAARGPRQLISRNHARQGSPVPIRTLILTPTRELAIQIGESFAAYGKFLPLKHFVIFGGVPQHPQVQALQRGVDILVATPGRLLDLIDQRYINLSDLKIFVLDEADRMLDMGFVHDVKKIITRLPQKRQTLFFSATMPPEIQKLASTILNNPEKVEVTPVSSTAETIQQSLYFVDKKDKKSLLLHILEDASIETALVFARTKHGADKIAQGLSRAGIQSEAIHGNKSQNARQRALQNFKSRQTRILVATDIAARGIDIDELTHVINFELPNVPETYVHRIGRTGRAGASGIAISFCDAEEKEYLRDIQKLIGRSIPVAENNPFAMQTTFFQQRQPALRNVPAGRPVNGNQRNERNGASDRRSAPDRSSSAAPGHLRNARPSRPIQKPMLQQTEADRKPIIRNPDQQQSVAVRSVPDHAGKPVNMQPRAAHQDREHQRDEQPVSSFPYAVNQSAGDERL